MNYTFCNKCENEFDLDEIGDENECPHCGCEYDFMQEDENNEIDEPVMGDYLADDGEWN